MHNRPKRSLGQNFLRDPNIVNKVVAALEIAAGEPVVEIGPGEGALTNKLIEQGASVTAIELDRTLAPRLQARLGSAIRVIEADALNVDLGDAVPTRPAKLVANLPYNISTPILQRLIAERHLFSRLVLMFQREVVERITAKPRTKDRGYLTVITEMAFETEYLFDVPPRSFYPVPKVWSAVVRLTPKPVSPDEQKLKEVASLAFAQKRKTLANNLSKTFPNIADAISATGLPAKCRAEELSLNEWKQLLRHL